MDYYLEKLIPYAGLAKTQRMFPMCDLWSRKHAPCLTFDIVSIIASRVEHPPRDFWLTSHKNIQMGAKQTKK